MKKQRIFAALFAGTMAFSVLSLTGCKKIESLLQTSGYESSWEATIVDTTFEPTEELTEKPTEKPTSLTPHMQAS